MKIDSIGIIRSILDASEEIEILSEHGSFRFAVDRENIRANRYPIARFCKFSITAVLRSNGSIKSVLIGHDLSIMDAGRELTRISEKLSEFGEFDSGWKNGTGNKISKQAVTYASDVAGFICALYENISVFPQTDGSITYEFASRGRDIEVRCRDDYVAVEVFDDESNTLNHQSFFGFSPKLIASLSDIEKFIS